MTNFNELPSFIIPILLQNLEFEDFANAFKVWMHRKNHETQAWVLSEISFGNFFKYGAWNQQFDRFLNYACNLGVHDALFYLPVWHLVRKVEFEEDAFFVLQTLSEEGHLQSTFAYNFFKILYSQQLEETAVQNIIQLLHNQATKIIVEVWLKQLHGFKAGWEPVNHIYSRIPIICSQQNKSMDTHFNTFSWNRYVEDIDLIKCFRCKVALLMFDFCNNNYNHI